MTWRGREQAAAGQEGPEAAAVPVVPDGVPGEGWAGGGASDCLSRAAGSLARRGVVYFILKFPLIFCVFITK